MKIVLRPTLVVFLCAFVCISIRVHAQNQPDLPELERLYTNPALAYAFTYPATWTVERVGAAVIAGAAQDVKAVAAGKAPTALTLRVVGGSTANFKLAPADGLPAMLGTIRPDDSAGTVTKLQLGQRDALRGDTPSGAAVAVRADADRWIVISGEGVIGQWAQSEPLFSAILATFSFNVEPVTYDVPVQRSFDPGTGPFNFTFSAHTGDVITLTMVASEPHSSLDPALALYGPDGVLVAQNDDSFDAAFGTTNARLLRFPIPTDGLYTIRATRSSDAGGDFVLLLKANHVQGLIATQAATAAK